MFEFKTNNFFINEEIKKYLENIIKTKLFANGYIFFGAEGLGKRQTALEFIKDIFNEYSTSNNISEKVMNNNHPDYLMIQPNSLIKSKSPKNADSEKPKNNNAGIIKIDQIRKIKTFLSQKSIESEKKIVLIIDAHLLNEAASNCLLKTLEEPSNGIFILLTSQLNLLLDTVRSRCQIVRFKSFSSSQIKSYLENNLDPSQLKITQRLDFLDLVNSANGSPGKIINNIEIWNELSDEIINKLESPIKNSIDILKISKLISEKLEIYQQIHLVQLLQHIWWTKTRNVNLVKKLETLKNQIKKNIQPRLAWEVHLLKIALEDL